MSELKDTSPSQKTAGPTSGGRQQRAAPPGNPFSEGDLPLDELLGSGNDLRLELAKAWVRANPTQAVAGSFSVGLLLGVLMER